VADSSPSPSPSPATSPPTFAWDWFARQRLPWREVHRRLTTDPRTTIARRYAPLDARSDVVALLRADYPTDPVVREVVDTVVRQVVFLDRTDVPLAALGVRSAPRGLRWWWTNLTGEALEDAPAPESARAGAGAQLALGLDDVLGGYGDPSR
jgi:hypothetical protein